MCSAPVAGTVHGEAHIVCAGGGGLPLYIALVGQGRPVLLPPPPLPTHNDASKEELYKEGQLAEAEDDGRLRKDGPEAEEDRLQRKDVPKSDGLLRKDVLEQDGSPKEDGSRRTGR